MLSSDKHCEILLMAARTCAVSETLSLEMKHMFGWSSRDDEVATLPPTGHP